MQYIYTADSNYILIIENSECSIRVTLNTLWFIHIGAQVFIPDPTIFDPAVIWAHFAFYTGIYFRVLNPVLVQTQTFMWALVLYR